MRRAGLGENGWVRLEWKYQVKMARSRSARKANVKLAWQYEGRMARSNGKLGQVGRTMSSNNS